MSKQPDITVQEDISTKEVVFQINREEYRVSIYTFERCCQELGIKTTQGVFSSFRLICEWFIREEQYIEFEEIK